MNATTKVLMVTHRGNQYTAPAEVGDLRGGWHRAHPYEVPGAVVRRFGAVSEVYRNATSVLALCGGTWVAVTMPW